MCGELNRYFIELQLDGAAPVPRSRETALRRASAAQFLQKIGAWLEQHDLHDKVAAMAITALGQVQITCEAEIINHIRDEDALNIAAIRQSVPFFDAAALRWNEAR